MDSRVVGYPIERVDNRVVGLIVRSTSGNLAIAFSRTHFV